MCYYFIFGCGMFPGFLIGYAVAMKRGWKTEDALRERINNLVYHR